MGTIFEKLNYLADSIDDIQAAINEKKVETDLSVPLSQYGNKIREIQTGGMWADYITMEAFPAFTETDLTVKGILNVTENVILGNIEGLKSRDYITMEAFPAFTKADLLAKTIEDITDTIEIIQNNYSV